jgi:hypothetical protein
MDLSRRALPRPCFQPIGLSLALALPFAALGCSDRALTGDADDETGGTNGGTETETEAGPEPDPSDTGEPEPDPSDTDEPEPTDCEAACADLDGGTCLTFEHCLETCASESPGWTAEIAEAFATCVAEDPLCFSSLASCLLAQLHPAGTEYPLHLTGVGFEAHEGRTIHVLHDPDVEPAFGGTATIVAGGFAFEWLEPVWAHAESGPLLLVWVDVDADGLCTAADLAGFVSLEWNADLLAPEYAAELTPPAEANQFVCGILP